MLYSCTHMATLGVKGMYTYITEQCSFIRSTMGPTPVGVRCTLRDVFPCQSVFAEIFSSCISDLHQSTVLSIYCLHGLSLLLIPSVMSRTNAFQFPAVIHSADVAVYMRVSQWSDNRMSICKVDFLM